VSPDGNANPWLESKTLPRPRDFTKVCSLERALRHRPGRFEDDFVHRYRRA
jgi:hypothetical protein